MRMDMPNGVHTKDKLNKEKRTTANIENHNNFRAIGNYKFSYLGNNINVINESGEVKLSYKIEFKLK
jgi:hypothetical protein